MWFYTQWVHHHMVSFQQTAASKATTMGHIQRGHLSSAITTCSPQEAFPLMSKIMEPLIARTIHNDLENRNLARNPRLFLAETYVRRSACARCRTRSRRMALRIWLLPRRHLQFLAATSLVCHRFMVLDEEIERDAVLVASVVKFFSRGQ